MSEVRKFNIPGVVIHGDPTKDLEITVVQFDAGDDMRIVDCFYVEREEAWFEDGGSSVMLSFESFGKLYSAVANHRERKE